LEIVTRKFDDKDVDNLIGHFRDKERRSAARHHRAVLLARDV
jgi:hypothetical protein